MKRLVNTCLLAATASWSLGCSGSDAATESDYDDVAQSVGALVSGSDANSQSSDVKAMFDSASLATGSTAGLSLSASAEGTFSGNNAGFKFKYTGKCLDSSGALMDKCGATASSANIDVDWEGTLTLPRVSATVTRGGSWTLSNIQTPTVQLDGEGDFTLDSSVESAFRNSTSSYHVSYSATYDKVLLARETHRVTGGQVKYKIKAERKVSGTSKSSDAKFDIDGVLEFSADGNATLTLDDSFEYVLNTASGTLVKK